MRPFTPTRDFPGKMRTTSERAAIVQEKGGVDGPANRQGNRAGKVDASASLGDARRPALWARGQEERTGTTTIFWCTPHALNSNKTRGYMGETKWNTLSRGRGVHGHVSSNG